MKKSFINKTHIEGFLYQHSLESKVTGVNSKNPGTTYITGTIEIATDDNLTNIVPVHFSYVTATTAQGKANATYSTLLNIIEEKYKSIMADGKDNATILRIDSAIGLNEFYSDRNGEEELISVKRNEGGFVHIDSNLTTAEKDRNTFDVDMIITSCIRREANEEKKIPEKVIVRGAIFDFRKSLLPVEFSATNPGAMAYFEGLGASNKEPVFTRVWGKQISESIVNTIVQESAFGEPEVKEYTSTRKDFVITGAAKETYEWDSEETITAKELGEAMTERETYLATLKQRNDEYKASKQASPTASVPTNQGFSF